jgi:hypothetical protein
MSFWVKRTCLAAVCPAYNRDNQQPQGVVLHELSSDTRRTARECIQ